MHKVRNLRVENFEIIIAFHIVCIVLHIRSSVLKDLNKIIMLNAAEDPITVTEHPYTELCIQYERLE